jgi:predicted aspartyl protease
MERSRLMAAMVWLVALGSEGAFAADACSVARAPDNPMVRVPFSVVDGRIYVDASVNGRGPFRFAVDTGASGVGRLDTAMLATLGLETSGHATTSDAVKTADVETTHLTSLALGSLERTGVDLITRDYKAHASGDAAFDGILGREFFSDGLLIIDYGKRQLVFDKTAGLTRDAVGALPYERAFRVPVKISGNVYQANIDTGANVNMVVPRRVWTDLSSAPLEAAATGQLTNTKIETSKGVVPGPIAIGGLTLTDVEAKVSDRFPEILIGAHALSSSVIAIDQRSQVVAVCPI